MWKNIYHNYRRISSGSNKSVSGQTFYLIKSNIFLLGTYLNLVWNRLVLAAAYENYDGLRHQNNIPKMNKSYFELILKFLWKHVALKDNILFMTLPTCPSSSQGANYWTKDTGSKSRFRYGCLQRIEFHFHRSYRSVNSRMQKTTTESPKNKPNLYVPLFYDRSRSTEAC